MGQKVNPHGLRVGIIADWDSRWYAEDKFAEYLVEDHKIRDFLKTDSFLKERRKAELKLEKSKGNKGADAKPQKGDDKKTERAGISRVEIERASDRVKVTIHTAKPGVLIGKGGQGVEITRKQLEKLTGRRIMIDVREIKKPDKDAQLVAENIAEQLERRISFRRAVKSCMSRTMKTDALGIKAAVSGRLGGADIARSEFYSEGTIPLQTLRADIDYGFAEANTTYGKVGVKVWIYKGEVLPKKAEEEQDALQEV